MTGARPANPARLGTERRGTRRSMPAPLRRGSPSRRPQALSRSGRDRSASVFKTCSMLTATLSAGMVLLGCVAAGIPAASATATAGSSATSAAATAGRSATTLSAASSGSLTIVDGFRPGVLLACSGAIGSIDPKYSSRTCSGMSELATSALDARDPGHAAIVSMTQYSDGTQPEPVDGTGNAPTPTPPPTRHPARSSWCSSSSSPTGPTGRPASRVRTVHPRVSGSVPTQTDRAVLPNAPQASTCRCSPGVSRMPERGPSRASGWILSGAHLKTHLSADP